MSTNDSSRDDENSAIEKELPVESDGRVEIYLQKLLPLKKVGAKVLKVFIFCSLEIV